MIPGFHGFDFVIVLVIALLIFGPKKLPEMGSAIGKSIKEYRKSMKELAPPEEEGETPLVLSNQVQHPQPVSAKAASEAVHDEAFASAAIPLAGAEQDPAKVISL